MLCARPDVVDTPLCWVGLDFRHPQSPESMKGQYNTGLDGVIATLEGAFKANEAPLKVSAPDHTLTSDASLLEYFTERGR